MIRSSMRRTIYVIGYPKSGTTWLARLLGDALDSPVGAMVSSSNNYAAEGQHREGCYYVRQGHTVPVLGKFDGTVVPRLDLFAYENLTDELVVFMVRDPRDVIISGMHHWRSDNIENYIKSVAKGTLPMAFGDSALKGGLAAFIRAWLAPGQFDVMTSYERLHSDTASELAHILDALNIDMPGSLDEVVERQSFDVRRRWTEEHGETLNYGRKRQLRFLRKGIVGDWRNHFNREQGRLMQQHLGDLMAELGYVHAPCWWRDLPE